ncbi:hypothetical protein KVF89_09795 [Nocardioides carbamazepini]|uniref:hypothetical protein n=1 Tax=Nocardioides carbamazepini TaxID=2854259 RepID=UPI002149C9EC|nr:hypothetical protein [Nocardioides carbamazepini]MCR1782824.1 hypothetical protein [Nocardioides carbamazepini]
MSTVRPPSRSGAPGVGAFLSGPLRHLLCFIAVGALIVSSGCSAGSDEAVDPAVKESGSPVPDTSSAPASPSAPPDGGGDRVAHYEQVVAAIPDPESITLLVVAGADRAEVAQVLGVDLQAPIEDAWAGELTMTGWALLDVPGGVLGFEPTGYGDPALGALRRLSADGRAAAVARTNIDAIERFGAARGGALVFDDDEYVYIEDPARVPAELRPLFDLVWDDLEGDLVVGPDSFAVALAMGEVVTGVVLTAEDIAAVTEAQLYAAPSLVYAGTDGG